MPKRIDANQPEIVDGLRRVGCSVQHLHTVGQGCPDLLVGFRGNNFLLEIKDGAKPPSRRKLTPAEAEWHAAWRGSAHVVSTLEEALSVVGATVDWQKSGRKIPTDNDGSVAASAGHPGDMYVGG